jgi:DNA polymerase-3 subunit beta
MKFIILQSKLKEGLGIVERFVGKNLTLPILNNILISVQKNFLSLTTTDLEIGIRWWSLVKVEEEGEIVIPGHILSSFINYFPNKPIKLETKDKALFVECESYQTQIKFFKAEDFPIIPQVKEEVTSLNNLLFCKNLALVSDIPQPSPARMEISGIYISSQGNLIKLVGTDSFRLGEKKIFLEKPITKNFSFILPQRTAKELITVMNEKKGELKIFGSPNQIMFELPMEETDHPQIQIVSRLIEGQYPNYEDVIPKKYRTTVVLPKNEFLNQIKAASVFSGRTSEVKFEVNPQKERLEIFSQNPEYGQYKSFLPAKIKGEGTEISFNYKYLIDGLANIKSSEVIFELNKLADETEENKVRKDKKRRRPRCF